MIYNLCNHFQEENLDVFSKINIIEASKLPPFSHLTYPEKILSIINGLDDTYQAMRIPFLPEKFTIAHDSKTRNNTIYRNRISFPVTAQNKKIKELLDTYNNKTVIAFVERNTHAHLYGTQLQPLTFSYDELHAPGQTGLKGFTLRIEGDTTESAIYFSAEDIGENPIIQGLAFPLAETI